jgi:hypothetical protein
LSKASHANHRVSEAETMPANVRRGLHRTFLGLAVAWIAYWLVIFPMRERRDAESASSATGEQCVATVLQDTDAHDDLCSSTQQANPKSAATAQQYEECIARGRDEMMQNVQLCDRESQFSYHMRYSSKSTYLVASLSALLPILPVYGALWGVLWIVEGFKAKND